MTAVIQGRVPARETLGSKLRRRAAAARWDNQYVNDVATGFTVTPLAGLPPGTLPVAYRIATNTAVFRFLGGERFNPFGEFYQFPVATLSPSGSGGSTGGATVAVGWQVEIMTDAAQVAFYGLGVGRRHRLLVQSNETDGKLRYIDKAGHLTLNAPGDGTLVVDLGSHKAAGRRIVIEGQEGMALAGVNVATGDRVWRATDADFLRAVFLTDSFGSVVVNGLINDACSFVMGRALGFRDVRSCAVGGTGYVANPDGKYTIGERVAVDLVPQKPDLAVFAAGINDDDASAGAIAAEVETRAREFRAACPTVPLLVLGSWNNSGGPDARNLAVEAGIADGVEATDDPLTMFLPVATDPAGPWLPPGLPFWPTGDQTHVDTEGSLYLGLRAADGAMEAFAKLP